MLGLRLQVVVQTKMLVTMIQLLKRMMEAVPMNQIALVSVVVALL